jgi:hypothetical protein
VLAVFACDQHRQAQIGIGLQRDRKSVVVVGLRFGVRHSVSLLAPPLITSKADRIKGNLRHHAEKPAGAGARRAREGDALLEFSGALDSLKWEQRKKRTLNLRKSAVEYRAKLAPILRYAKSLALIDPYLNSHESRCFDTINICSNVMGQRGHARLHGRIDIHAELGKQKPDGLALDDYLNGWEQKLRPLVTVDGHRFRIFLWEALPGSEILHDRYILTDQCCISAPGGLDCRTYSHANRTVWSLLDEDDRQQVSADYDQASTPFKLEGNREVQKQGGPPISGFVLRL